MFAILQVAERLLLEEAIEKESLDLFELGEQLVKLLVVVFLYRAHFLAHAAQLRYLVFDLVLELAHLSL